MNTRSIWTREGRRELKPLSAMSTFGATSEERTKTFIGEYANTQPGCRDVITDVYVRAYRRAGLIDGDPDEIATRFPDESARPKDELPLQSD